MRKRFGLLEIGILLLLAIVAITHQVDVDAAQAITATTPSQYAGAAGSVHTNCQLSPAGGSVLCLAGDGAWLSVNGGAWVQLGGATAGVTSISINGSTPKTGAVTFTIAAAAPTISAPTSTAPPVTAQ